MWGDTRTIARQLSFGLTLIAAAAQAAEPSNLFVGIDNDLFTGSDREYTSGVHVGATSATVDNIANAELAPALSWANDKLERLQPKGFEENNVTWTLGQRMFTPEDWSLVEPDLRDRPYAGLLFASVTYNGRDSHTLHSTSVEVGILGPSALAEQAQKLVHRIVGADEFLGWDHQLNDEPVFRVLHERFRRWDIRPSRRFGDVTAHYGGSIGTLATFANAGAELRIGRNLPDDFGSAPTLAYGQNTAPTRFGSWSSRPRIHGFIAADVRAVLRDVTLDGNTFRDSASVDRETYVGELAVGMAFSWRAWLATLGATYRTKQYESQKREASFGTLTFRRALTSR